MLGKLFERTVQLIYWMKDWTREKNGRVYENGKNTWLCFVYFSLFLFEILLAKLKSAFLKSLDDDSGVCKFSRRKKWERVNGMKTSIKVHWFSWFGIFHTHIRTILDVIPTSCVCCWKKNWNNTKKIYFVFATHFQVWL